MRHERRRDHRGRPGAARRGAEHRDGATSLCEISVVSDLDPDPEPEPAAGGEEDSLRMVVELKAGGAVSDGRVMGDEAWRRESSGESVGCGRGRERRRWCSGVCVGIGSGREGGAGAGGGRSKVMAGS